jgi:hypothetical protein
LGALLVVVCVVAGVANHTGHEDVMIEQRLIALVFFVWGAVEYARVFRPDMFKSSKPP